MKFSIEKSDFFVFIYRYIDKLCLLCLLIALIAAYLYDLLGLPFFIIYIVATIIVYCSGKSLGKVAYKICFDTEKNEIQFYMLKNDNIITCKVFDLLYIEINGHMYFHIKNNCVYWHSPNFYNKDEMYFLEAISRLSKIKWGWLSNLDSKMISIKKEIEGKAR